MALDDRALVEAMRGGDAWAWSEFHARFRPVLAAAARRARLPADAGVTEAEALVDEVLADEATRLAAPGATAVPNVAAYLVRAARHKLIDLRRASARRQRWYAAAARPDPIAGEVVLEALCSEHLLATSAGVPDILADAARDADLAPRAVGEPPAPAWGGAPRLSLAILELATVIRAATTEEERLVLTWVAERVSHRMIATWLGVSYDAATKRIWRLCRKLRAAAVRHVGALGPEERAEVERFLRRAGVLPPLVAAVSPAAARRDLAACPFGDDAVQGGAHGIAPGDARARSRASAASSPDRARRSDAPTECDDE